VAAAVERIAPFRLPQEKLFRLPSASALRGIALPQSHARPAAVFVNELDAGLLKRSPDCLNFGSWQTRIAGLEISNQAGRDNGMSR